MLRYAFLCLFLASSAFGSAIKGREEAPIKGHAIASAPAPLVQAPIQAAEQYPLKGGRTEQLAEQRTEETQRLEQQPQQQKELDLPVQQREEIQQIREEAPKGAAAPTQPLRFEARPQVVREELSKTQRTEQRLEPAAQQQIEQKLTETAIETQREYDQQIELKDEQHRLEETKRRYEEPQLVQTQYQPLEQVREEQQQYQGAIKGQAPLVAPIGEAEPYAFNYQIEGSSRYETGDTKGTVRGQYTLQGADGSSRVVDYIADRDGFRANINTNEFGTQARSPANVALRTSQPDAEDITLRLEGKTREFLNPPTKTAEQQPAALLPPKPDNWQVKGQSPLPAIVLAPAPTYEEIKTTESRKTLEETHSSAKGERLAQEPLTHSELKTPEQPQQIIKAAAASPVETSARTPKSLAAEPRLVNQPVVKPGFQSATAHRVYRGPVYQVAPPVARPVPVPVPVVPVRSHPVPVPVVRTRVHGVHQSPVGYSSNNSQRHPPSPVQGYRRTHQSPSVVDQPGVVSNPRAPHYAAEDDHTNFERS